MSSPGISSFVLLPYMGFVKLHRAIHSGFDLHRAIMVNFFCLRVLICTEQFIVNFFWFKAFDLHRVIHSEFFLF
jgi:hypothetical protein